MNNAGVVDLACWGSVAEVTGRLAKMLKSKGLTIFARIDQAAEAEASVLDLRPMVLVIFGDPKAGTPLMIQYPTLAIDLPLKALVWESAEGKTWLSYSSPDHLQQRHGMAWRPFEAVEKLLQAVAQPVS